MIKKYNSWATIYISCPGNNMYARKLERRATTNKAMLTYNVL